MIERIKRATSWYKFLRAKNNSLYASLDGAVYNSAHWEPVGEWPYNMKKLSNDKSEHRLYTSKYEDLCM